MMGNYGWDNMMSYQNSSLGFGFWGAILYIILIIDLVLLGIWLWRKITKDK